MVKRSEKFADLIASSLQMSTIRGNGDYGQVGYNTNKGSEALVVSIKCPPADHRL
jgi:hypothetical protein